MKANNPPTLEEVSALLVRLVQAGQPIGITVEQDGVLGTLLVVKREEDPPAVAKAARRELEQLAGED